jgi:glycerol-3-phosphate dehydrogenase
MVMVAMLMASASAFVPPHFARRATSPGAPIVTMSEGVTQGEVHGEGGAYVGGYWVPLADCPDKFNVEGGSNERTASTPCPRSSTRHSAAKADGTYDVAIIGAGCIGAAVARELSKTTASVVMIEAADDVCQGATKGNSGIVHAGFDDKPGSTRARLCWKGNQMFPALDEDLHFGYQLTGSLVCARGPEEEEHLNELLERGATNGVANLRIVRGDELKAMEPNIAPEMTAALHSPDAGTLIPYEYTIALAENAADNGVEVRIRRALESIGKTADGLFELNAVHWEPTEYVESQQPWTRLVEMMGGAAASLGNYFGGPAEGGPWEKFPELVRGHQNVKVEDMKVGGSGSMRAMGGVAVGHETIKAKYVINCAGGASDKIARMVGDDSFTIQPRLGEYVLLKKSSGSACNHILFPCPGKYGKGVLVQKTLWGNLILGPTARDVHEWADPAVDPDDKEAVLHKILSACRRLVPDFDTDDSFHSFSGARAKSTRGDWIIERCFAPGALDGKLVHAAGIDSPGIAGSPAIALEVVAKLAEAGFEAPADPSFNPKRAALIVPKQGDEGLVYTPDDKTSLNPLGVAASENVVCKCEKVTEAEVVEACHRSLPVDSTQAIRKRTRAGMGGCQGKPWNYGCECRVAQIIARETKAQTDVVGRRPWSATSMFPRRWITAEDKEVLQTLSTPPDAVDAEALDKAVFDQVEAALPLEVSVEKKEESA